MALISLEEAKTYLRVDADDEDALIGVLLSSAEKLCADVARLSEEQWSAVNGTDDNTLSALKEGTLTRGELQRNAANICRFLLHTHALDRMEGSKAEVEVVGEESSEAGFGGEMVYYKVENEITIDMSNISTGKGADFVFTLDLEHIGGYRIEMTGKSELSELAQIPVTVFYQSVPMEKILN